MVRQESTNGGDARTPRPCTCPRFHAAGGKQQFGFDPTCPMHGATHVEKQTGWEARR